MTGMTEGRILWIVGLAMVGSACGDGSPEGGPSASTGEPERWTLSAEPTLEIGVVEGDERYQLHGVTDAARLADGRIALAHGGTAEVRVFDGEGRFVLAAGGPGDGPGEWRQVAAVDALPGDTLVVVDPILDRVGLVHGATGAYLGELDEARAAEILPHRRHHTGLILEAPAGFEAWGTLEMAARAADIRSAQAPAEIRMDDDGRLWVFPAPSAADASLRVLDLAGAERAVLSLPDRFEPLAVDEHEVIGVWRDSLDVEHLRVYAVEGAGAWTGADEAGALVADSDAGAAPAEAPELVGHFRDIAIAQEMHYAGAGSYTTNLEALAEARDFALPPALRVDFLAAGPTGWWGRLVDMETGAGCSLVYGAFLPVEGLTPGALVCWDGPGGQGAGTDP
jgi:hypothetical protein